MSLREQFEKIRTSILCRERDDSILRNEVKEMREKMRDSFLPANLSEKGLFNLKQSRGGIADIEFLTQYLVLKLAASEPSLVISSNTSELLAFLARKDNLSEPRLKELVPVYAELRRRVNTNAMQNQDNNIKLKEIESINTELVIELWDDILN